jgi:two-component system, NarL family, response regulator NreC
MPFGLVLAESHELFRRELRRVVEANSCLKIAGEADDLASLLDRLEALRPELILIDIFSPKFGGTKAITQIRKTYPNAKILVLTMYHEEEYTVRTLAAGADGYLLKESIQQELIAAIESVKNGKKYLSPTLRSSAPKNGVEMNRAEYSTENGSLEPFENGPSGELRLTPPDH